MKKLVYAGVTDQTIDIFVPDSSSTTGAGLTGLVYNSSGLTCYYRKGATGASTQLSLATQTVTGAHSDGGFVEIDSTNMKGMYRLDLSDTIVATAGSVTMQLQGATNMAPVNIELQVISVNLEDAVRMGLTALPNAAADAAGGLPISDAGGLDLDALNTAAVRLTAARAQVLDDWINNGRLDLILDIIAADVVNIDGAAMRGTDGANTTAPDNAGIAANGAAIAALNNISVANILAGVVEGTVTVKEALMIAIAAAGGKTDGFVPGSTGTGHLRNTLDTKNRITATYDENGNRTSITFDLT